MTTIKWTQEWKTTLGEDIPEANYRRFLLSVDGGDNIDMQLPYKANGSYSYAINPTAIPLSIGNHIASIRVVLKDGEKSGWAQIQFSITTGTPVPPSNLTVTQ